MSSAWRKVLVIKKSASFKCETSYFLFARRIWLCNKGQPNYKCNWLQTFCNFAGGKLDNVMKIHKKRRNFVKSKSVVLEFWLWFSNSLTLFWSFLSNTYPSFSPLFFAFLFSRLAMLSKTSLSVREIWGSVLGPVRSGTVSPTSPPLRCFFGTMLPRRKAEETWTLPLVIRFAVLSPV